MYNSRTKISHYGKSLFLLLILLINFQAKGQEVSPKPVPVSSQDSLKTTTKSPVLSDTISEVKPDTIAVLRTVTTIPEINSDTIPTLQTDTIPGLRADTIPGKKPQIRLASLPGLGKSIRDTTRLDSLQNTLPVGDITTTVDYKSRDSINLNVRDKIVKLYGQSKIEYKPVGVDAAIIEIDWNTNIIVAVGVEDSLGNLVDTPVFRNGNEVYETKKIRYNFKTRKAIISGMVTEQGDGFIHGDRVFKNEKDEMFIPFTKYTTCNLRNPHYYIAARNVKIIPGNKMVTGPFNMVMNDVPTPLGFFFGMFPEQKQRTSGLLIPSYGEQTLKGFYIKNGGYYFAFNDYVNLALTGSIYSRGGFGANIRSQYVKRYKYNGDFQFNLTKQLLSTDVKEEPDKVTDFRLSWGHTPKSMGSSRFSARVNASTSTYNQNNVLRSVEEQINTTLSSSVSFSKTFQGTPISMGINGRFNQNVRTKKVDLLLPEFSMNVQNIYPFQSKSGGSNSWYDRLTFRYTMNGVNKITNQIASDSIAPFDFETLPKLIANAKNGIKHVIPVSTSLKAFRFFTINPSLNYQELWYNSKLDFRYDSATMKVITDTLPGFNRVYSYSTGVSLNTRVYGTYFFKREYGIQAIRHVMTPSLSYSYRPDFADPKFDYWQEVQTNEKGDTRLRSRYEGFVYGSPGRGEASSLSFSLTNTLEMKVKSKKDTTGKSQKVALLRNFGMSTSYNFAADSFQLSVISVRATTNLLNNKKVFNGSATMQATSINLTGNIDPYVWVLDSVGELSNGEQKFYQRRIDKFAWNNGDGLGTLTNITFNMRTGIRAKERKKGASSSKDREGYQVSEIDRLTQMLESGTLSYQEELMIENILNYPQAFVDFNIPWGLSATYSLNFRRVGVAKGDVTQTVRFNGDMSLTPKWKLTFNSGYDIEKKEFTQTRIGLHRDLHCWELNFSWVPFGRFTSYDFTIRAKSRLLQDLRINRRRSFTDNIF